MRKKLHIALCTPPPLTLPPFSLPVSLPSLSPPLPRCLNYSVLNYRVWQTGAQDMRNKVLQHVCQSPLSLSPLLILLLPSLFLLSHLPPKPLSPSSSLPQLHSSSVLLTSSSLTPPPPSVPRTRPVVKMTLMHTTLTQVLAVLTCGSWNVWPCLPYLIGQSEDIVFRQKLFLTADEELENVHQHYRGRLTVHHCWQQA